MNKTISPSTAASVANRVYDIRKSYDFSGEFHNDFVRNFKVTNNQIQGVRWANKSAFEPYDRLRFNC